MPLRYAVIPISDAGSHKKKKRRVAALFKNISWRMSK
jgi:hypothetical protein